MRPDLHWLKIHRFQAIVGSVLCLFVLCIGIGAVGLRQSQKQEPVKTTQKTTKKKTTKTLEKPKKAMRQIQQELMTLRVPHFVGLTLKEARHLAGRNEMTLQFVDKVNKALSPEEGQEYIVIAQSIPSGETMLKKMVLRLSLRPQTEILQEQQQKEEEQRRQHQQELQQRKEAEMLRVSAQSVEKAEFEQNWAQMDFVPSYDELKKLAEEKYGMDERSFILSLGWLAGDNLEGQDDYGSFLSGCCPINVFLKMDPDAFYKFYTSWGSYYHYDKYVARAQHANDYIRRIFYLSLMHLDTRATEANGMCVENGYNAHSIEKAFYKVKYRSGHILPTGSYDGWFGVWSY